MSLLLASVASATGSFTSPKLDWHALAPEVILTVTICLLITADVVLLERARPIIGALAGLGLLAAIVPLLTLATSDKGTCIMPPLGLATPIGMRLIASMLSRCSGRSRTTMGKCRSVPLS